jgi:DNA-directed RNA polymerase subunit RPC12/RpoP
MQVGDRSRCLRCGGKIILINHPSIISLDLGLWVHESATRRMLSAHAAHGPSA